VPRGSNKEVTPANPSGLRLHNSPGPQGSLHLGNESVAGLCAESVPTPPPGYPLPTPAPDGARVSSTAWDETSWGESGVQMQPGS